MAWRSRNPHATIAWDQPKTVVGILRDIVDVPFPDRSVKLYVLECDGQDETCWGAAALDQQIRDDDLGRKLRIDYLGKRTNPKNKREFHAFEVAVWIEAGDAQTSLALEEEPVIG